MGAIVEQTVLYYVGRLLLFCVGIPVAVLFAAYFLGIIIMTAHELWKSRQKGRRPR